MKKDGYLSKIYNRPETEIRCMEPTRMGRGERESVAHRHQPQADVVPPSSGEGGHGYLMPKDFWKLHPGH